MDKFKKGFKAFKSGIKLKKKKKDKDSASIGGVSQSSAAGAKGDDLESIGSDVYDPPPYQSSWKTEKQGKIPVGSSTKASPVVSGKLTTRDLVNSGARGGAAASTLHSGGRGAASAVIGDEDLNLDEQLVSSESDSEEEPGLETTTKLKAESPKAGASLSLGLAYGASKSKGNQPIESDDKQEELDDLGSWPDTDTDIDLPSEGNTPRALIPSTADKRNTSFSEDTQWSETESENQDRATPLIKTPAAVAGKPRPKSESESAWSDEESEKITSKPSSLMQSKPVTKSQVSLRSDSGSAWSDEEPAAPKPTKPIIATTTTSTISQIERQSDTKSESESAWTDDDDDLPLPAASKTQPAAQIKQETVLPPKRDSPTKSHSESGWTDEDSPEHKANKPQTVKQPQTTEQSKLDATIKSESESAWSDDDDGLPLPSGANTQPTAQPIQQPKLGTMIQSDSESEMSDDDGKPEAAPTRPAVSTENRGSIIKTDTESGWSDNDDAVDDLPDNDKLSNPQSIQSRPLSNTTTAREDKPKTRLTSETSESAWSEDDHSEKTTPTKPQPKAAQLTTARHQRSDLYEAFSSGFDEDPNSPTKPEPNIHASLNSSIPIEPVTSPRSSSEWSDAEQGSVKEVKTPDVKSAVNSLNVVKSADDDDDSVWSSPISQEIAGQEQTSKTKLSSDEISVTENSTSLAAGDNPRESPRTKLKEKLNEAQKENFLLQQQLNELKEKAQRTQKELENTRENNESSLIELTELVEKYQIEKSERENLMSENDKLKQRVQSQFNQIQEFQTSAGVDQTVSKQNEQLNELNECLERELQETNTEHEQALQKLKATETELRAQLQIQSNEKSTLLSQLNNSKLTADKLQTEFEENKKILRRLQEEFESERDEKLDLQTKIQSERAERQQSINKLQHEGANIDSLSARLVENQRETDDLRQQLHKQVKINDRLVEELNNERRTAVTQRGERERLNEKLNEAVREKERVESQLAGSKSELSLLGSELREMREKFNRINIEKEQLRQRNNTDNNSIETERIQMLEEKNKKLLLELSNIQNNAGSALDASQRAKDIQKRREKAERELKDARERQRIRLNSAGSLSSCESTPRRIPSPIGSGNDISSSSSDEEEAYVTTAIPTTNGQNKELDTQLEKITQLKRENADLQNTISALQSQIHSIKLESRITSEENDDLKSQLDKMEEKLRIRDSEVTMELHQKLESNMAAQASVNHQKQQIILLESQVSQLKEELSTLESRYQKNQAELKVKEEILRSENRESVGRSVLDAELINARTELEHLRKRSDDDRSALMTALEEKDREIVHEQTERELMKEALDEVSRVLLSHKEELSRSVSADIHQDYLNKQTQAVESYKQEVTQLKNELNNLSRDLASAKEVVTMQQNVLQQKDKEISDRTKEIEKLHRHVQSIDRDAQEAPQLKTELKNYQDRLTELNQEYMELLKKASSNEAKFNEAERLNSELNKEMAKTREDLRNYMLDRTQNSDQGRGRHIEELSQQLRQDFEWYRQSQGSIVDKLNRENEELKIHVQKLQDADKERVKLEGNLLITNSKLEEEYRQRGDIKRELETEKQKSVSAESRVAQIEPQLEQKTKRCDELQIENSHLKSRNEVLQRDNDNMRDSRHDVSANNQTLTTENHSLRESVAEMKAHLEHANKEITGINVSREELDAAIAAARTTTDISNLTKQEAQDEVFMERKHKIILYKQVQQLKKELNEKTNQLDLSRKLEEKLKNKIMKQKSEILILNERLNDKRNQLHEFGYQTAQLGNSMNQLDTFQRDVQELQSKLDTLLQSSDNESLSDTSRELTDAARKSKAHRHDANYYKTRCDDLRAQVVQLSNKLNDSVAMLKAAERAKADLKAHINDLNSRLREAEQNEEKSDKMVDNVVNKHDQRLKSLSNENQKLKDELRSLKSTERISRMHEDIDELKRSVSPQTSPTLRRESSALRRNASLSRDVAATLGQSLPVRPSGSSGIVRGEKDRKQLMSAAWSMIDRLSSEYGRPSRVDVKNVQKNLERSYQLHSSGYRMSNKW